MSEHLVGSVGVVIPTYKRPSQLHRALTSLVAACENAPPGWTIGTIVVDDDPSGSAAKTASIFRDSFELGCTYVFSGAQNISAARNAGVKAGLDSRDLTGVSFDWLASLDDDVVVPNQWIAYCAKALSTGTYNAVTGPLMKDFSLGPRWLTQEPFDQLGILRGTDGNDAFVCATGNNWVAADFFRDNPGLRFDLTLGRSGGEDMDFFYRAVEAGLKPMFSLDASVVEPEPRQRCTFRYQARRAYWLGLLEARVSLRLHLSTRTRLLARAVRRTISGGARQLPLEAINRRGIRYRFAVFAQCVGLILGCFGVGLRHR